MQRWRTEYGLSMEESSVGLIVVCMLRFLVLLGASSPGLHQKPSAPRLSLHCTSRAGSGGEHVMNP